MGPAEAGSAEDPLEVLRYARAKSETGGTSERSARRGARDRSIWAVSSSVWYMRDAQDGREDRDEFERWDRVATPVLRVAPVGISRLSREVREKSSG